MTFLERVLMKVFKYREIAKDIDGVRCVYLRRFFLWRRQRGDESGDGGGIFLHHILRSDDDPDPHTHPWDFSSLILKQGYWDESFEWIPGGYGGGHRRYLQNERIKAWRFVRRKAQYTHRVELDEKKAAWTLVFAAPRSQEWGFLTRTGWVMWKTYLGIP